MKIKASLLSGGKYRTPQETGLSRVAAKKAYRQADLEPKDINFVEVHDATSFCEIYQLEMLGFVRLVQEENLLRKVILNLAANYPLIYREDWCRRAIL